VSVLSAGVTVGVRLPNSGPFAGPENILSMARQAEELGYDAVWVHDHISWAPEMLTHLGAGSVEACDGQDPNFYESITTVAVLGGQLRRIHVGIAGLVLPLRDPRVLAKQLVTVEHLIGRGRLIVACGIGNIENDFETMGVPWNRRGRIANDYLGALRAITGPDQPISYANDSISVVNGHFLPAPQELHLWIAGGRPGTSEASLKRAARYGSGWLTGSAAPSEVRSSIDRLRELLDEEGRDPDSLVIALEVFTSLADDLPKASAIARNTLARRNLSEDGSLVGAPGDIIARMHDFQQAGVDHFELKFVAHTPKQLRSMMERIAVEVLPAAVPVRLA
jgi:alkanesulfonate monooxygenase SsuD/methylene tetrahydromethanopterin reductase-like flavin-dependent oxidoreductase (luciferase family)